MTSKLPRADQAQHLWCDLLGAAGPTSPKRPSIQQPLQAIDLDKVALILDLPLDAQNELMHSILQRSPHLPALMSSAMTFDGARELGAEVPVIRTHMTELMSQLMLSLTDL